jgi:ribonuclease PH
MRNDRRNPDQLRPVVITPGFVIYPEGSALITAGNTRVLCNVTVEEGVPRWMEAQGLRGGWITAEYAMLPRATHTRSPREDPKQGGRTAEIRRLIGRSLRAAVDLEKLGRRTLTVDCDVIQADGGTRTAAITGGYVALAIALDRLIQVGAIPAETLKSPVAAVSTGIVEGEPLLDLCYQEDSAAQVDVNVVMNARHEYIEVQGTAEGAPYTRQMLDRLLDLAAGGIEQLLDFQKDTLNWLVQEE